MSRDPNPMYPPAWVWIAVLAAMIALSVLNPIRWLAGHAGGCP